LVNTTSLIVYEPMYLNIKSFILNINLFPFSYTSIFFFSCLLVSSFLSVLSLVLFQFSSRFSSFFLQTLSSFLLFISSWYLLSSVILFYSLLWRKILLLLSKSYYLPQILQILAISANSSVCEPQRTISTIPILSSCILFVYLFVNRRLSTIWS